MNDAFGQTRPRAVLLDDGLVVGSTQAGRADGVARHAIRVNHKKGVVHVQARGGVVGGRVGVGRGTYQAAQQRQNEGREQHMTGSSVSHRCCVATGIFFDPFFS